MVEINEILPSDSDNSLTEMENHRENHLVSFTFFFTLFFVAAILLTRIHYLSSVRKKIARWKKKGKKEK
jgi:hypothetical protein